MAAHANKQREHYAEKQSFASKAMGTQDTATYRERERERERKKERETERDAIQKREALA